MSKQKSRVPKQPENFELISMGFLSQYPEVDELPDFELSIVGEGINEREAFEDALNHIEDSYVDKDYIIKKAGNLSEIYYNAPLKFDSDEDDYEYSNDNDTGDELFYFIIHYNKN